MTMHVPRWWNSVFCYLLLVLACDWGQPSAVRALPSGGQVAGGSAGIQTNGTTMTIQQQSINALLNWQGFSIGAKETVQFLQPSATSLAVNRVLGGDPSVILGNLLANGRVFLLNPNGVVFGPGSVVNVGGLLATTLSLKTYDLDKGQFTFAQDPTKAFAAVVNQGTLRATEQGFVVLTAPGVVNEGLMVARFGHVGLGAGSQMAVDFRGDGLIQYAVDGKVMGQVTDPSGRPLSAAVTNAGRIEADGGTVLLTAHASSAVVSSVINQSGVIQARRLESQGGEIVLKGGDEGIVQVAGALDATAMGNGQWAIGERGGRITVAGDRVLLLGDAHADGTTGGTIAVQGTKILQTGTLSADGTVGDGGSIQVAATSRLIQTASALTSAQGGPTGQGGLVQLTASDSGGVFTSGTVRVTGQQGGAIHVLGSDLWFDAAMLDASGTHGGGTILVGGDYQGQGPLLRAQTTEVNPSTTLKADATQQGDGGRIIVWSDHETQFFGSLSARGGPSGGNGGLIEVSSKGNLYFGGTGDAGAPAGTPGQLLLDPLNIVISNAGSIPQFNFNDPNPNAGNNFGETVVPLSTGKVVITSPQDDFGASNAGAIYMFNGQNGALISTLTGGQAGDQVGSGGATALTNGNFVVRSVQWHNGSEAAAGAVTWGNGTTGISGTVSPANSLVGTESNNLVGSGGVTALTNGNYVVASPFVQNGATFNVGAVTWGNGTTGITGPVSAANSLVGTQFNDAVGQGGVTALSNGNYVVSSPSWANGGATIAGAVTWGNGTTGITGAVTAANSLVGSQANDFVGGNGGGVTALGNGNYVVRSPNWANGGANQAGAVTWGSGTTGIAGPVSAANSLVGSQANDRVGIAGVMPLFNGNYVALSPFWANGGATGAGAVTWANGTTGITGPVSAGNSLVGTQANDNVGVGGVMPLLNGNYVAMSPNWANGGASQAGAATWGNGTTGISGTVSAANSLVGTQANDKVSSAFVTPLTNGNYVVASPNWANGGTAAVGAATWGNGTTGITGAVSAGNSLIGSQADDKVGSLGATPLLNGNYVVSSPSWATGGFALAGAATWGNGTTGTTGAVSAANSIVGTKLNDQIASVGVTALTNGNYVVASPNWANGGNAAVGAATWGNGNGGTVGAVSAANSLVGTHATDQVSVIGDLFTGTNGVTALTNGNYVVASSNWTNGGAGKAGAVTWGDGNGGTVGPVSAANSLVGTQVGDSVGFGGVTALANGNYVVRSQKWNNGSLTNAGAVTWGAGTNGVSGVVSSANSIVGNASDTSLQVIQVDSVNGTFLASFPTEGGGRVTAGLLNSTLVPFAFVGSQSITIAPAFVANLLTTGTAVTLQATQDLTVSDPVFSSGSGALNLQAGRSIVVNANVTTTNGALTLEANQGASATGNFVAVDVNGAQLSTQGGAISLFGRGGNIGTNNFGIQLRNGAAITTDSGIITLTGIGGTGDNFNVGVHLESASAIVSGNGPITITGTGGNGTGIGNRGVDIVGTGTIVSSTTGTIDITGTGGANTNFSYGIVMAQGRVTSTGAIHLTGQGGAGGPADIAALGILITNAAQVEGTGSATVTVTGTGGTGTATSATNGEVGVFMHGQNGTFIRTADGDLTIHGTGNGTGIGGQGVIMRAGALVEGAGFGNVLITGIGSTTGSANSNGIQMIEAGTTVRSNLGNIVMSGTAHGALNSTNNIGTAIASGAIVQKTVTGGTVTINGSGGDGGGGSNNFGVALLSAPTQISANNGGITINGDGGTGGAAGVTAQGGFTVGAPGIPCGACAPSANIAAGAGGTITINSSP